MSKKPSTPAQIRASMNRDLTPSVSPPPGDQLANLIRLNLDQVEVYENNPRTAGNPEYPNILESIRNVGLQHRMSVIRRPGREKYTLARGGGTRYRALRALWDETQERRFYELDFELVEYVDELHLLSAHLSENLNRADMVFWDKATGIVTLVQTIKASLDTQSLPDVAAQIKQLGLPPVSGSLLAYYEFATTNLSSLGAMVYDLTMASIRDYLQPQYSLRKRLFLLNQTSKFHDIWEAACSDFVIDTNEANANYLGAEGKEPAINWPRLIELVESRIAEEWKTTPDAIRRMAEALKLSRNATWHELSELRGDTAQQESAGVAARDNSPPAGGSVVQEAQEGQPSSSPPVARSSPSVFTHAAPAASTATTDGARQDEDRPPPEAIEIYKARQRAARDAQATTTGEERPRGTVTDTPPSPASSHSVMREGILTRRRETLLQVAYSLASQSRSLSDMIMEDERLPMGWLVDIPESVLSGLPLAPQAKQIWWLLAQASLQIPIALRSPEKVAGTFYGEWIQGVPLGQSVDQYWSAVKPVDDTSYLLNWLMDPAYTALGNLANGLLSSARDLLANHPDQFREIGHHFDFDELKEEHQANRHGELSQSLIYFVEHGADRAMVSELFPEGIGFSGYDTNFRPGRTPELDPNIALGVYQKWGELQSVPSDRARYLALHQSFPDQAMATLFHAIRGDMK